VAQLSRPPALSTPSPATGRTSFIGTPSGTQSAAAAASIAGSNENSPLARLQKRLTETSSTMTMTAVAVTESKSSFHEVSMKTKISDLELINQELKEDLARKARQSADLSVSLKKSLELIQQQNKALTDQLTDISHEKDAQIDALDQQLAALQGELAATPLLRGSTTRVQWTPLSTLPTPSWSARRRAPGTAT
jgi:tRNA U34 5-carboxymethylaminomethyl modifying GTPase MnmE/TrmE